MSKSSGRSWGRKSTGTVTVIEARVHRSSARNAKLAFWVTLFVVGLLSATVIADRVHPILALFTGAVLGVIAGGVVWALVRIWPVLRLLWWWSAEICLALGVVYGFTALARHTSTPVRLVVLALVVGVPAALPWTRRRIVALAWCQITRHRLRTCFDEFIIANQSGTLPLILWARPIPVGERVWVWLRPGLSLADLQSRLDKIAVTCWASGVTAEPASDGNAAYVRLDIKRRQVLTSTVDSPLIDLIGVHVPATPTVASDEPTALDLPDVADPQRTNASARTVPLRAEGRKPAAPQPRTAPVGAGGEDLSDWID